MHAIPFRVLSALLVATAVPVVPRADTVLVFAPSSLTEALSGITESWMSETGHEVTLSFAGSSVLARQIEAGALADVFISANVAWMDRLEGSGAIRADTRRDLVSNRLVLIGRDREERPVEISPDFDFAERLGADRLAMALVDAVPAGIYGKAALEALGLWQDVAPRVAQTDNVRAALALVAIGAAPLGIVYATDAAAEPRVSVVGTFPASAQPDIRYPAALTSVSESAAALDFLDHLSGAAAADVFRAHGFGPPG